MSIEPATRDLFAKSLAWGDAHVTFEKVIDGIPERLRGTQPPGVPYSPWQLLEHLRITQHDILEFCRKPDYEELEWPKDYWPASAAPPSASAWDDAVAVYLKERGELQALAVDKALDLHARIPHGSGQTYARELILVTDHTAYHVGQLVLVRRLLGIWKAD
jgi:hypothetical protein